MEKARELQGQGRKQKMLLDVLVKHAQEQRRYRDADKADYRLERAKRLAKRQLKQARKMR